MLEVAAAVERRLAAVEAFRAAEEGRAQAWAKGRAAYMPAQWRRRVLAEWGERRAEDERGGNTWLRESVEDMRVGAWLSLDATDAEVIAAARDAAADLYEVAMASPLHTLGGIRRALEDAVRSRGIAPPDAECSDAGAVARIFSAEWWIRRVRVAHGRRIERHAQALGYVHRKAECYVSDVNVERRAKQRERNARALAATEVENQHGDVFTLAELAERSNANPRIRRAELMTRIAGFEAVAKGLGHAAEFWTGTCPSRFHAVKWSGERNPKHDGSDPRAAQAHLVKAWAKCRAAMARQGIRVYGFRIAEPHHDGCPHWHLLLFMPAAQVVEARAIFRRYFLDQHDASEEGAAKNRVKFVAIDPARGSAAGYVAKYVAKNIDGYALGSDLFGNDEITTARRVDAWASQWGIRQFQQIGGAPVGVWRELRRLAADAGLSDTAEAARLAADAGVWERYTEVMGGPLGERRNMPLRVAYTREGEKYDPVEECTVPAENAYGEPAAPSVFGVRDVRRDRAFLSRRFRWEVRRASPETKAAAERRAAEKGEGVSKARRAAQPWTRVNNCTEGGWHEKRRAGGFGDGDRRGYGRNCARHDAGAQKGARGAGIRGGGSGVVGDPRGAMGDSGGACAAGEG